MLLGTEISGSGDFMVPAENYADILSSSIDISVILRCSVLDTGRVMMQLWSAR